MRETEEISLHESRASASGEPDASDVEQNVDVAEQALVQVHEAMIDVTELDPGKISALQKPRAEGLKTVELVVMGNKRMLVTIGIVNEAIAARHHVRPVGIEPYMFGLDRCESCWA